VEKIDKNIIHLLFSGKRGYKGENIDKVIKDSTYPEYITLLSAIAKAYKQREARKERQKKHRENKNAKDGKPKE
jgi:hypothetical protein